MQLKWNHSEREREKREEKRKERKEEKRRERERRKEVMEMEKGGGVEQQNNS